MDNSKIALFDSGVGQLSVYLEIKKLLPLENFVIYADQKNMPYGGKSSAQINKFVLEAAEFLINRHNVKMLILACNTATVLALDKLRKSLSIPVIGVVPAIKPAAEKSQNRRIVNMSTPATAESPYLQKLINSFAQDCKVLKLKCPGLENAVEKMDQNEILTIVKKYSKTINKFNPDIVVLGCTHYPLVKKQIEDNLSHGISVIDSGAAIARQVSKTLKATNQMSSIRQKDIFYTTGDSEQFSQICSAILGSKVLAIRVES